MSRIIIALMSFCCMPGWTQTASTLVAAFYSQTNSLGSQTNGSAVVSLFVYAKTNILRSPWADTPPPPTTLPLDLQEQLLARRTQTVAKVYFLTNFTFEGFVPGSLQNTVWTNLIAHTNGRSSVVWNQRTHPPKWPKVPPLLRWNTESLIWGMKGMTALAPCWEVEGTPGVIPITALTRRHGYARGHGIRQDGFGTTFAGKRVWFLSDDNQVVQVEVLREVVRTLAGSGRDYTLFLFNKDLPVSISPMRVVTDKDITTRYTLSDIFPTPCPLFYIEQQGNVSANLPGFTVQTYKGGDSGSANMLPMPGELVFFGGRTTSPPSPEMQTDMDALCKLEGLTPARYQMQWVNLSRFAKYQ